MISNTLCSTSDVPTPSSSPAHRQTSTPPSSPPGFPWDRQHESPDASDAKPAIPSAFSLLGKRKALDAISDNARPAKKSATAKPAEARASLTQMHISIGQAVQKRCKTCGMEYVPSSAEDRKLHDKYHTQHTHGFDVGKDFVTKAPAHLVFPGARQGDAICVVDCYAPHARKRKGQAVLELVQRELGAVHIPEDELWNSKSPVNTSTGKYRMYLYIRDSKCIGLLLAQKVQRAHRVTEPTFTQQCAGDAGNARMTAAAALKARQEAQAKQLEQPLQLSREDFSAKVGISRIWTSPTYRRQDVAMTLLHTGLEDSRQCAERQEMSADELRELRDHDEERLSKDSVAFSQPTAAGTRLARRWFGQPYGWKVYID